jgi:hypothetical protein
MTASKSTLGLIFTGTLALVFVLGGCGSSGTDAGADPSTSNVTASTSTGSARSTQPTTLDAARCQIIATPLGGIQKALDGYGQTPSSSAAVAHSLSPGIATWSAQALLVSGDASTWLKSLSGSADRLRVKMANNEKIGVTPLISAFAADLQKFSTYCH